MLNAMVYEKGGQEGGLQPTEECLKGQQTPTQWCSGCSKSSPGAHSVHNLKQLIHLPFLQPPFGSKMGPFQKWGKFSGTGADAGSDGKYL